MEQRNLIHEKQKHNNRLNRLIHGGHQLEFGQKRVTQKEKVIE